MSKITAEFIDALHRLEESSVVDVIASLFADDAILSNPLAIHDEPESGAAKLFWKAYRDVFEDIASEFINVVEGDKCAMLEWRSDGTVQGQAISYSGVSVIEFETDLITSFRAYFDPRELTAHAGSSQHLEDLTPSDVQPADED